MNHISTCINKEDNDNCQEDKGASCTFKSSFPLSMTYPDIENDRNGMMENRDSTETCNHEDKELKDSRNDSDHDDMYKRNGITNVIDEVERRFENLLRTMFLNEKHIDHNTLSNGVNLSEFKQLSYDEQTIALEEVKKIQQMNSWDTYECTSPISLSSIASDSRGLHQAKEDKAYSESPEKNKKERFKKVKFDYPVVTAMRQLPRLSQNEIKELFFSVEELRQSEQEAEEYEEELQNNVGIEIILSSSTDSQSESGDDNFTASGDEDELSSRDSTIDIESSTSDNAFAQDENVYNDVFNDKISQYEHRMETMDPSLVVLGHQNSNEKLAPSSTSMDEEDSKTNAEQEFWIPVDN